MNKISFSLAFGKYFSENLKKILSEIDSVIFFLKYKYKKNIPECKIYFGAASFCHQQTNKNWFSSIMWSITCNRDLIAIK